ncbi:unnamed protein product [Cochlearia groenlandica]
MEMKMEENLGFVNILRRATKLLCGNINLALFLFLCSLPLFSFLIFFELYLQTTVSFAAQYLSHQLKHGNNYNDPQDNVFSNKNLIALLIQTFLLYLFPYSLVDLLATTTIVSASSVAYTTEEGPLRFGQMVKRSIKICKRRVSGCLITSLYVLLLSTSVFSGFLFAATNYMYMLYVTGIGDSYYSSMIMAEDGNIYLETRSFFYNPERLLLDAVMALFHGAIFVVLLAKFSKWSAGWNMGLVVSVLEEGEESQGIYGTEALSLSAHYGRGHEKPGFFVMLVFLVFALAMRMPCLCFKCSENSHAYGLLYTSLYVGLVCVGNVVKWVACVVWYYDCRTRVLEKKGEVEIGSKANVLATM